MLVNSHASCFIDAVELALGPDAADLRNRYLAIAPKSNPDLYGFHPTVVNMILLEQYKIGIAQIDCIPAGPDGIVWEGLDGLTEAITKWFKRPNFRCVLTGINDAGNEHAVAYNNTYFFDPANPNVALSEPPLQIRSLWLITLPPEAPAPSLREDEDDSAELQDS